MRRSEHQDDHQRAGNEGEVQQLRERLVTQGQGALGGLHDLHRAERLVPVQAGNRGLCLLHIAIIPALQQRRYSWGSRPRSELPVGTARASIWLSTAWSAPTTVSRRPG